METLSPFPDSREDSRLILSYILSQVSLHAPTTSGTLLSERIACSLSSMVRPLYDEITVTVDVDRHSKPGKSKRFTSKSKSTTTSYENQPQAPSAPRYTPRPSYAPKWSDQSYPPLPSRSRSQPSTYYPPSPPVSTCYHGIRLGNKTYCYGSTTHARKLRSILDDHSKKLDHLSSGHLHSTAARAVSTHNQVILEWDHPSKRKKYTLDFIPSCLPEQTASTVVMRFTRFREEKVHDISHMVYRGDFRPPTPVFKAREHSSYRAKGETSYRRRTEDRQSKESRQHHPNRATHADVRADHSQRYGEVEPFSRYHEENGKPQSAHEKTSRGEYTAEKARAEEDDQEVIYGDVDEDPKPIRGRSMKLEECGFIVVES